MNSLTVTIDNETFDVEVTPSRQVPGEFVVIVGGQPMTVYVPDYDDPELVDWMLVDNRPYELVLAPDLRSLQVSSGRYGVHVRDKETRRVHAAAGDGRVKAPIPGLITRIHVEPGQLVDAGQPILVLEAMKMENEIRAPRTGTVRQINVKPGQTVTLNELLAETRMTPAQSPSSAV